MTVWLDKDELQPGLPWQNLLESGIRQSRSVAVLIGKDGLGPWEIEEMDAALSLAVRDKRPVIPVLLPDAPNQPHLPMFLANRTWVDLRPSITAENLGRLIWGITGKKPEQQSIVPPDSTPIPSQAEPAEHPALSLYRKKLDFLLVEEAKTVDPEQKFNLLIRIEEVRQIIKEFKG